MNSFTKLIPGFTAALLMAFAVSACSKAPAPEPKAVTVALSPDTKAQPVSLNVGDTLAVELDGNPTTGFLWLVADGVATNVIAQEGNASFSPKADMPGSPGKVTLTFKAKTAGEQKLELVYKRPFEAGKPPAKTVSVDVRVK